MPDRPTDPTTRPPASPGQGIDARSRTIDLEGSYNFRDIGGYLGADGRAVRWRRVFRADNPGSLTAADLREISALGIRTVCDLRRPNEQDIAPSRLVGTDGVEVHVHSIGGDAAQRYALTARMLAGEIRSFTVDEVVDVYLRLLRDFPESFSAAVALAAEVDRLPLLVHCTAGKDRTGLVIAAILEMLGVSDADIAHDYLLSERGHHEGRVRDLLPQLTAVGIRYEDVAPFLGADPAVMRGTLQGVREEWGGFAGYLQAVAGFERRFGDRLRAALLEPSAGQ
jgi:protein-tyrosine phosphatase